MPTFTSIFISFLSPSSEIIVSILISIPFSDALLILSIIAFGSSLDQIGPFTNNVEDSALILNAIKGRDENDPTSKDFDKDLFLDQIEDFKNLKIGIPKEYFPETLDKEIKNKITDVIDLLIEHGAEVEEVSLPHTEYALGVYYILAPSEASSNLARYDGVKYGFSDNQVSSMWERIENSRSKGFGIEVKRRIMLGTYALSSGYYDEYYGKAEQVRQLIKQELNDIGYESTMIFVNTDLQTALRRNKKRERTLPDELIHKNYAVIEQNLGRFQRLFDDVHIINNSDSVQNEVPEQLERVEKDIRKFLQ